MIYIHALQGLILLAAIALIINGPWQWCMTDFTRGRLFELRDRLFDMAVEGRIEFSSPAYKAVRAEFNQQIRFAHDLSIWRFVAFFSFARHLAAEPNATRKAIQEIEDAQVKADLSALLEKMGSAVILMMVLKSPTFLIVGLILVLTVALPIKVCKYIKTKALGEPTSAEWKDFDDMLRGPKSAIMPIIRTEAAYYA